MRLLRRIARKSKLRRKDAVELARKIKEGMARQHQ